jgi:SAM-dependent methyltransferase
VAIETYERLAYTSKPYRHSTPVRTHVIARLFGVTSPDPRTARVLEIGCAGGGNLLPLASLYPDASFVGLDPATNHIAQAEATRDALGLTNARFVLAPIEELDPSEGPFDYIVCHGVFSWVPETARRAILEACRDRLAPNGIAYISYNTLPGWHMRRVVRDAMMFHVAPWSDPQERITQARAMVHFLADVTGAVGPMGQYLEIERENMERYGDDYLFHEHLSPDNDPLYFHEFMALARGYGLKFLGEAELPGMMPLDLRPDAREVLSTLTDDLERSQQYMDFLVHRAFRQTLLVHQTTDVDPIIQSSRAWDLHGATQLHRPDDGPAPLDPGVALTFMSPDGRGFTTDHPVVKAALLLLRSEWAGTLPVTDLAERAAARVREAGIDVADDHVSSVAKALVLAAARGLAELWPFPVVCDGGEADRPQTWPIARLQAAAGLSWVTSQRHEPIRIDELDRRILLACDGTRDRTALADALHGAVLAEDLVVEEQGRMLNPEEAYAIAVGALDAKLHVFGRLGLFVPREVA